MLGYILTMFPPPQKLSDALKVKAGQTKAVTLAPPTISSLEVKEQCFFFKSWDE